MARSKRRLGKGIADLMAENARIDEAMRANVIVPTQVPQDGADASIELDRDYQLIPQPDRIELQSRFQRDPEFNTEFVEDAKPPEDNYGQGPSRSTRVRAHKFVPYNLMARAGLPGNTLGTVYVKFQPHSNGSHANDVYRYRNVPESVYKMFANSTSKGRFINQYLNHYPYARVGDMQGTREDRHHVWDFEES